MLACLLEDSKRELFGDGVVVGYGKINGRRVSIFSQDFTVKAGTTGDIHRGKMTTIIDKAIRTGIPIIGLRDSTGGKLEQSNAPHSCARSSFFRRFTEASGVIPHLLDDGEFFELKLEFAKNIITGFGRLDGYSVGIVASQPLCMGGALTIDALSKEARFIRLCDALNIPLIFLADTPGYPGYLPGSHQEHGGILRHGAKVLYAIAETVVPKIAVLIRKAYGGQSQRWGLIRILVLTTYMPGQSLSLL